MPPKGKSTNTQKLKCNTVEKAKQISTDNKTSFQKIGGVPRLLESALHYCNIYHPIALAIRKNESLWN